MILILIIMEDLGIELIFSTGINGLRLPCPTIHYR